MQVFNYDYLLKYIIIGDSAVGKSNLLLRYVDNKFNENHVMTLGVEFAAKNIQIEEQIFRMQIWDTAGQENFRSITRSFYKNSACVIIVYDITSRETFTNVKTWIKDCMQTCSKNVFMVLVGNKVDDETSRQVSTNEGETFAKEHGMTFFESSAKTGKNVEEIFKTSAKEIAKRLKNGEYDLEEDETGIKRNIDKNIILKANNTDQTKCCYFY